MTPLTTKTLGGLLWVATSAQAALQVDLNNPASLRKAASQVAYDLMTFYSGNQTGKIPGILPGPPPGGDYYWWEGGALWGTMIDYWLYTGDESYIPTTMQSLIFQSGPPQHAYMPDNWTASLGNDDQGFWGMSAMLAAETMFPDPPSNGNQPGWLELAQAVFNTQAAPERHDSTCGGGMRWQIPQFNIGYDYKNSIANGIFFNLGARLARYTRNTTYSDYAEQTWDWMAAVGLMDDAINVYDGAHVQTNCTDVFKAQFSYNAGVLIQGAAFMYNISTGATQGKWKSRLDRLIDRTIAVFFETGPMIEISCELPDQIMCKTDMLSFKGYVHRWMANAVKVAPYLHDKVMNTLRVSAAAAVSSCSGGANGRICGFRWNTGKYDGLKGAGQQMNALAAIMTLLVDLEDIRPPVTNSTGGTSKGDPDAGGEANPFRVHKEITAADRAGAGILTALWLAFCIGLFGFITGGFGEGRRVIVLNSGAGGGGRKGIQGLLEGLRRRM
ncbi:Glycosyl hydrolase family 76 domain containing protein [Rhypophila sp. PSN 637]